MWGREKQEVKKETEDNVTKFFRVGTKAELLIILGYRGSTYLAAQFNVGIIKGINIIFIGLYGFMDSIWLIGSIALGTYIIALVENKFRTKNRGSQIVLAFCMLGMLLGAYSIDVIEKHLKDLSIGTGLILNTFQRVDSGVLAGGTLLFIITGGIVYFGFKTYISVKDSTFPENMWQHPQKKKNTNLKQVNLNTEEAESIQDNVNKDSTDATSTADVGGKEEQEEKIDEKINITSSKNSKGKFVWGAIFLLLLPILTVFVFTILQSSWLSEIEVFEKYKNKFQNNQTIDLIVEWAIPWAMVCTAILIAAGIAFIIMTIYQCIKNENLVHPQALFAIVLEAILIAASPVLKKIDAFNSLLEMMVDGGVINTLIALVVFYFAILTFLVLLFVPKTDGTESFEKGLRDKCTDLLGRIQDVAVGLLDSGVRIIEFATVDYIKAIFGVLGIQNKKDTLKSKKKQE